MTDDGLSMMLAANKKARERSARKITPPRHPRKTPPAPPADVVHVPDESVVVDTVPAPAKSSQPAPAKPADTAPAPTPTIARSVQLDEPSEDLLDRVRTAGRRLRVDANRSATIRLALRRLEEQLSPERIAAELKKSGAGQRKSAGRRAL